MSLRLVAGNREPHQSWPGATALQSVWSGAVGVAVDQDTIVWPGIELRAHSTGDYSSTYSISQKIELYRCEGGWLLRVLTNSWEMFAGDSWSVSGCWLGSADGRNWHRIENRDAPNGVSPVDTMITPPPPDRCVTLVAE